MRSLVAYVFQQMLWLLATATQLIASMGIGIKWVVMTFRCIIFAMLDLAYFTPHIIWYLLTPTVIRRVAYRSSRKTKVRNLEVFLSDYERSLRQDGTPPKQQQKMAPPSPGQTPKTVVTDGVADLLTGASINLADGSTVRGLPVNLTDELNKGSFANNSFGVAVSTLQKILERRQKKQQEEEEEAQRRLTESLVGTPPHRPPPLAPLGDGSAATDDDEEEEEDEEDRNNVHNRATLDIFLPVPMDSLFRFLDHERRNRSVLKRKKFPIIITVNGGAWIVGCYLWNFLIARIFAARGYVVFCPDYRNFPQATLEGMTLDVSDAIAWVLNNAERYNGDLGNVTLMGQSAGAHLTMMSLISQAHLAAYEANKGQSNSIPPPSDVAYNVPRYNPRRSIHRYVGLSGIYNVRGLVQHLNRRGLYRNVLYEIAGGKANLSRYSVTSYFDERKRRSTGEVLPNNLFHFLPEVLLFVHGDADKSAPVTESANLAFLVRNAQRDHLVESFSKELSTAGAARETPVKIEYIVVPGATHTCCIIEEPLACKNSHVVELLLNFSIQEAESAKRQGTSYLIGSPTSHTPQSTPPPAGGADPCPEAAGVPARTFSQQVVPSDDDDAGYPIVPHRRPDGILLSPAPWRRRPLLVRLAAFVNPF
ncbi:ecotin [Strigomonas culicis]|uniref:Ecotin n=1 Tax=Strigomonas culicis TaxID=28005 RepID=S9UB11_9TRYP|nr:ecotin [Strigomonas culicis]|eukprot:EPY25939.1 ecotin [Strigomonas culicis]